MTNYSEILKYIQSTKDVINSLFDSLREFNPLALKMIYEICVILKSADVKPSLSKIDKTSLFLTFSEYNLFETLEEILGQRDCTEFLTNPKTLKLNNPKKAKRPYELDTKKACFYTIEIFNSSFIYCPDLLQSYAISEKQKLLKFPLLKLLFNQFLKLTEKNEMILVPFSLIKYSDAIKGFMVGDIENPIQIIILEEFYPKLLSVLDTTDNELMIEMIIDLFMVTIKFFGFLQFLKPGIRIRNS